jgi:formyltetrahydrofolate hydrolase
VLARVEQLRTSSAGERTSNARVLSRAVLWHSQDRVIRHGNQTIVFPG